MDSFKILTYNIDGLCEYIDLNTLPLVLRPISWIYKLIKKTSFLKINDNNNVFNNIKNISQYLSNSNADIIGVQEDFDFHKNLISKLKENYEYGRYLGGLDISNIKWLPIPRFKCDGINLFVKKQNNIKISNEKIIKWNKSNGYFGHANDKLVSKGYRYYNLVIDGKYVLNIYIVHMDADFYDPIKYTNISKDLNARKSQLKQLTNDILTQYKYYDNDPIIIIGDTNSYQKYKWDKENIKNNLIDPINSIDGVNIEEAIASNYEDCDRIFYINNNKANYSIKIDKCYFDKDLLFSDHKPLIAEFKILANETHN